MSVGHTQCFLDTPSASWTIAEKLVPKRAFIFETTETVSADPFSGNVNPSRLLDTPDECWTHPLTRFLSVGHTYCFLDTPSAS